MNCPRHDVPLVHDDHLGVAIDRCPQCGGFWLDHHELEEVESAHADEETRRGTRDYARREGELRCPACGKVMTAFNYRAHNLEIDVCDDHHGYWLDAGEEERLRDVLVDRAIGLARARFAEEEWEAARRRGGKRPGFFDRLFGRR